MGCGIASQLSLVVSPRNYLTVADHYRTDRNVTVIEGARRFGQSQLHGGKIVHATTVRRYVNVSIGTM
jgi:hypothetical protein